jgi:hypothetical protein
MQKAKVSIQFTSLTKLWEFRMAIGVNIFEMNMSEMTITCDCSSGHIQMAIDQYNGKLVETRKEEEA